MTFELLLCVKYVRQKDAARFAIILFRYRKYPYDITVRIYYMDKQNFISGLVKKRAYVVQYEYVEIAVIMSRKNVGYLRSLIALTVWFQTKKGHSIIQSIEPRMKDVLEK